MPRTLLTQKTALLPVQTRPPPDVAPGPFGDELLSRPRERAGVLQCEVDVLVPEDGAAHLQSLFEKLLVEVIDFRIRRHGVWYNEGVDRDMRWKMTWLRGETVAITDKSYICSLDLLKFLLGRI